MMQPDESSENDDGRYFSGIEYTRGYYSGLNPLGMSFLSDWKQRASPNPDDAFTYLELGCGNGVSANVLAAANPHASFYANDFNAEHCWNARELSRIGGVSNLTILEVSFADLLKEELPQFDYISLHGVYSWISDGNRKAIVEIVRRFLKPHGLLYVSYNCTPGNAGFEPVRRALSQKANWVEGEGYANCDAAMEFIGLLQNEMPFFESRPNERKRLLKFLGKSKNYVYHELFSKDWAHFYRADIVLDFEPAGVSYVGSCDMRSNFPEYELSDDMLNKLGSIENSEMRDMFHDLSVARSFRKDVFSRFDSTSESEDLKARKDRLAFALTKPLREMGYNEKIKLGEVALKRSSYEPIVAALSTGPKTIGELGELGESSVSESKLMERLHKLMAFGYLRPCHLEVRSRDNSDSSIQFNRSVMANPVDGIRGPVLASPLLGSGLAVPRNDQRFLAAEAEGADPVEYAFDEVTRPQSGPLSVNDRSSLIRELESEYEYFSNTRLKLYQSLRMV